MLAQHFGHFVQLASSAALVGFGLWIAMSAVRELRSHPAQFGHMHWHSHAPGQPPHRHWHEHHDERVEPLHNDVQHTHEHPKASIRTTLLVILGSSPMIEGIPAFFAASRYGVWQLAIMSVVFAFSTVATYVILVALSVRGMERVSLGRFERYGEVISGIFVALIGAVFFLI